jgi:hypothetical protein
MIELEDILRRGLAERGVARESVFTNVDETKRSFYSMPSFDVSVTLKTAYHRDPSHRWTANDILDVDALSSTVPYCDVVVTDKAAAIAPAGSEVAKRPERARPRAVYRNCAGRRPTCGVWASLNGPRLLEELGKQRAVVDHGLT